MLTIINDSPAKFDLEVLLCLLKHTTRSINYAEEIPAKDYPVGKLRQRVESAWRLKNPGEAHACTDVLGRLAVSLVYFKQHFPTTISFINYRSIIRAIKQRADTTDEEIRSETQFFSLMVHDPGLLITFLVEHEDRINLNNITSMIKKSSPHSFQKFAGILHLGRIKDSLKLHVIQAFLEGEIWPLENGVTATTVKAWALTAIDDYCNIQEKEWGFPNLFWGCPKSAKLSAAKKLKQSISEQPSPICTKEEIRALTEKNSPLAKLCTTCLALLPEDNSISLEQGVTWHPDF